MRTTTIIGIGAALLLAAGCSSSHPAAAPVATQSSAAPAVSASSAAPNPSSSPQGDGKPLGTAQTATSSSDGVTIKVTASSYKVITLSADNQELAAAGTKVALVQATGCLVSYSGGNAVSFTWSPWTLVTSSGATVTPLSAHGTADFPGSLYPNDSQSATLVGRCRSGLIPFSLANVTGTPVMVEYNVSGVVLDWNIG